MIIYMEQTINHIAQKLSVQEANDILRGGEIKVIGDIKYVKFIID